MSRFITKAISRNIRITMKNASAKKLCLNSIKNPEVKRILKPCEARAGHGAIALIISVIILGVLIALAVKLFRWFFN